MKSSKKRLPGPSHFQTKYDSEADEDSLRLALEDPPDTDASWENLHFTPKRQVPELAY